MLRTYEEDEDGTDTSSSRSEQKLCERFVVKMEHSSNKVSRSARIMVQRHRAEATSYKGACLTASSIIFNDICLQDQERSRRFVALNDRMLPLASGHGCYGTLQMKRKTLNSQEPHRIHFASTAQELCIASVGIITHFLTAAVYNSNS